MGALLAERLQQATPEERHRTVLCGRAERERERHWHATASQRPTFHSCGHVPECRERETKVSRQRGWEDEVSALPYPNYYIFDQEMVGMLSDAAELRMDPSANMILYLPTSK